MKLSIIIYFNIIFKIIVIQSWEINEDEFRNCVVGTGFAAPDIKLKHVFIKLIKTHVKSKLEAFMLLSFISYSTNGFKKESEWGCINGYVKPLNCLDFKKEHIFQKYNEKSFGFMEYCKTRPMSEFDIRCGIQNMTADVAAMTSVLAYWKKLLVERTKMNYIKRVFKKINDVEIEIIKNRQLECIYLALIEDFEFLQVALENCLKNAKYDVYNLPCLSDFGVFYNFKCHVKDNNYGYCDGKTGVSNYTVEIYSMREKVQYLNTLELENLMIDEISEYFFPNMIINAIIINNAPRLKKIHSESFKRVKGLRKIIIRGLNELRNYPNDYDIYKSFKGHRLTTIDITLGQNYDHILPEYSFTNSNENITEIFIRGNNNTGLEIEHNAYSLDSSQILISDMRSLILWSDSINFQNKSNNYRIDINNCFIHIKSFPVFGTLIEQTYYNGIPFKMLFNDTVEIIEDNGSKRETTFEVLNCALYQFYIGHQKSLMFHKYYLGKCVNKKISFTLITNKILKYNLKVMEYKPQRNENHYENYLKKNQLLIILSVICEVIIILFTIFLVHLRNKLKYEMIKNSIYHIPSDTFTFGSPLTQGIFSQTWNATLFDGKINIEIGVIIKQAKYRNKEEIINFREESIKSIDLNHKRVLKPIGISIDCEFDPMIILPVMMNGSLLSYLHKQKSISRKQLIEFVIQIAEGMVYLSSKGYIHKDLAARNCLLDQNFNIKITDLGLKKSNYSEIYIKYKNGIEMPIKWMAPESILNGYFSTQSDVWSYGVLVWEIMSKGCQPYAEISDKSYIDNFRNSTFSILSKPEHCSYNLFDVLKQCWSVNYRLRKDFQYITSFIKEEKSHEYYCFNIIKTTDL